MAEAFGKWPSEFDELSEEEQVRVQVYVLGVKPNRERQVREALEMEAEAKRKREARRPRLGRTPRRGRR